MKLILMVAALFAFPALAAMSEEQCETQAKGVFVLLQMVEDGSMPVSQLQLQNLQKAKDFYEAGEYCKSRQLILNLNSQ